MNTEYSNNPGFIDLAVGIYRNLVWYFKEQYWKEEKSCHGNVLVNMAESFVFKLNDICPIFYCAIIFTFVRYIFENLLFKPLTDHLHFNRKGDRKKLQESTWKFLVYAGLWLYTYYLLIFSGRHNYFDEPFKMWNGWKFGMDIPFDVKLLYFIETGFYFHSIYATIYMDEKRKDYILMLLHHIATIFLLTLSFGFRYHRLGLMVVFCHDIHDVLLEFTKCNVYLGKREGSRYRFYHEVAGYFGFAILTLTWFLFRLYWFPLKIIYTSGVTTVHRNFMSTDCKYMGFLIYASFNILLIFILLLNFYWFHLILQIVVKIAKKSPDHYDDIRDYDAQKKDCYKKKNN